MGKGGGGSVTVAYRYFVSIHKALCHGPIDKITKIQVDEKLAWIGTGTHGTHYIDNYDLFGGESREGGIQGYFDINVGDPDQKPNPHLQKFLGPNIPAFRGVTCVVLKDMYMGINPYLKKFWYRTQRIHKRSGNKPQWEDTLAEINVYGAVVKPTDEKWEYVLLPQTDDLLPPMPTEGWQETVSPLSGGPSGSNNWKPYHTIWARKKINLDPFRPIVIAGSVENAAHFFINGVHLFSVNETNEQIYENEYFAKTIDTRMFPKGENELQVCGLDEWPPLSGSYTYLDFSVNLADSGAMNPAHIIRECLTDVEWGMGYPEADMDDVAFRKAAVQLFNEGLGMCILWDQQQELQDFIGDILRHIDGSLYVDRKSGKFVLKLARDDWKEDIDAILHLDENTVESVTNFKRPTFGELVNTVTVNYWDMALGADRSVTVTDIALAAQGGANASSIDFKGFPTADIATRIAQRELTQLSTPLYTCTVLATTVADVLNIGDVFLLSWGDYSLEKVRFRVSGIAYGDGKTNKVRIECVEDNFESPMFSSVTDQYPEWVDPIKPASPTKIGKVIESPYYKLVQLNGQDPVDLALSNDNSYGILEAIAAPSENAQNVQIIVDKFDGVGPKNSFISRFGSHFVLDSFIDHFQTTIGIRDITNLTESDILTYGYINNEIVQITKINLDENTIDITRGCLDTIPETHEAGSHYFDMGTHSNVGSEIYYGDDYVNVGFKARGFSNVASVTNSQNITFGSRAARPYPPANVKANGVHFIENVGMSFKLEMSHRSRKQMTGKKFVSWFDGSVGDIGSIKYVFKLYLLKDDTYELFETKIKDVEANYDVDLLTEFSAIPTTAKKAELRIHTLDEGLESVNFAKVKIHLIVTPTNLKGRFMELINPTNLIGVINGNITQ